MEIIYESTTKIKLKDGEIIKSSKRVSEYSFDNNIRFEEHEVLLDLMVDIDLGEGRILSIRPSDVEYIDNKKVKVESKKEND